ncbi:AMP-binding protein [Alteribacillus sp. YIM 98480]|uniref:AMP-binding protein n=1 Tax=Alteribacillus sp. YIM 98480 TaxID=2606599 RepID=UPI00131DE38E|nr:AMP-binding protein [Alteribacillus sp. YIM 98480]
MTTLPNRNALENRYSDDWRQWSDPDVPEYFNPMQPLFLKHAKTSTWSKTALLEDGKFYSYAQLYEKVCQTAEGLISVGLETEDRLLLFGSDSLEYLSTWLGSVAAGIIPAVVSDLYKSNNLLYFLRDTSAKALFINEEQLSKLMEVQSQLPETLKYVIVDSKNSNLKDVSLGASIRIFTYKELIKNEVVTFEPIKRHRNDMAYMFYSGGTTGKAKGIVHLMHDFYLVPERQGAFWDYTENDICLATSKKYFTHGLWPGVLMPLYFGGISVITLQPMSIEQLIKLINRDKPTTLITVPTIIKNLLQYCKETGEYPDFSSLRMVVTASEKIPLQLFDEFYDVFGLELLDSIGSSEITYEWIANRPKDFKRGSLGKPVFGIEVKLIDEEGHEVTEADVPGEAWVKSETTSLFYWRKFTQTKETFIGEWTRTNDILHFDSDGYYWYNSRSDDQFKVKGLWVSPIEIEAEIMNVSSVLETAVVPFKTEEGMIEIKACVVLRPGYVPSEELTNEIKQSVRKIGGYKVPNIVKYMDSLPRTTLSKIDRKSLRNINIK